MHRRFSGITGKIACFSAIKTALGTWLGVSSTKTGVKPSEASTGQLLPVHRHGFLASQHTTGTTVSVTGIPTTSLWRLFEAPWQKARGPWHKAVEKQGQSAIFTMPGLLFRHTGSATFPVRPKSAPGEVSHQSRCRFLPAVRTIHHDSMRTGQTHRNGTEKLEFPSTLTDENVQENCGMLTSICMAV